jgi:hypothetical protein
MIYHLYKAESFSFEPLPIRPLQVDALSLAQFKSDDDTQSNR